MVALKKSARYTTWVSRRSTIDSSYGSGRGDLAWRRGNQPFMINRQTLLDVLEEREFFGLSRG